MIYPLVSELAVDGIPVTVACRVLKLARQPYYRWKRDPVAERVRLQARRMNVLFDGHVDDATLGYRQLANFAPPGLADESQDRVGVGPPGRRGLHLAARPARKGQEARPARVR